MGEQLNRAIGSRSEICLPSFGWRNLIFVAIPKKKSLSQTSTGCDHGFGRILPGRTPIHGGQIIRRQAFQTHGGGCEIIQQGYVFQIKLPRKRRNIYNPRHVFRVMPTVGNHARDSEPSGIDFTRDIIAHLLLPV